MRDDFKLWPQDTILSRNTVSTPLDNSHMCRIIGLIDYLYDVEEIIN